MPRPQDIEVSRALYAAGHRYGFGNRLNPRYQPGIVARHRDVVVTMARNYQSYTVSYWRRRWYVHLTRTVFLAWRRGRLVGMLALTWCGSDLVTAELTDEPAGPPCRRCAAIAPANAWGDRQVTIVIQMGER